MSENWPSNLSNEELAREVEAAEMFYLAELNYMNAVGEENAGMLPNDFDQIAESVNKSRERYDKLIKEITLRIRIDRLFGNE